MVRLFESSERGDSTPLSPLRARTPAHATDESLGLAGADGLRPRSFPPVFVAHPTEDYCEREHYPRRKREREHDESHAENEPIHTFVVVAQ
ncbi:MAG: hypothetical protein A2146_04060 [Actinobacteria bacterium RBG_16_67_10]|nr:MAG: hypothetical protein A2146_04060 [Actinobacteria bacterium RBG_16_67_10]